jgi:hypothetical protein
MPTPRLSATIARLGRTAKPPDADDAGLLARFALTRDEAAFAELVRRHGPMMYAVCRRITGTRGWVYGVAVRTDRRARTVSARTRARETPVPILPELKGWTGRHAGRLSPDGGRVLYTDAGPG